MIIAISIIIILLGILFGSLSYCIYTEKKKKSGIVGVLFGITLMVLFYVIKSNGTPSAIDVYQDKTDLLYITKGDVLVDSVVVFKPVIHN